MTPISFWCIFILVCAIQLPCCICDLLIVKFRYFLLGLYSYREKIVSEGRIWIFTLYSPLGIKIYDIGALQALQCEKESFSLGYLFILRLPLFPSYHSTLMRESILLRFLLTQATRDHKLLRVWWHYGAQDSEIYLPHALLILL